MKATMPLQLARSITEAALSPHDFAACAAQMTADHRTSAAGKSDKEQIHSLSICLSLREAESETYDL